MKVRSKRGRPADVRKFAIACCECCQDEEDNVRKHACRHLPKEEG